MKRLRRYYVMIEFMTVMCEIHGTFTSLTHSHHASPPDRVRGSERTNCGDLCNTVVLCYAADARHKLNFLIRFKLSICARFSAQLCNDNIETYI